MMVATLREMIVFFVSHRKSYLIKVLSSYKDYLE